MAKPGFSISIADHFHPSLPREALRDRHTFRARTREPQLKSTVILGHLLVNICALVTTRDVWFRDEVDELLHVLGLR